MEEKKNPWVLCIISMIVVLVIGLPIIIGLLKDNNESKRRHELIMAGKTVSQQEIATGFAKYLKENDESNAKKLLAEKYSITTSKSSITYSRFGIIKETIDTSQDYMVERRGDGNTYRIKYGDDEFITILMEEVVTSEEVTYRINSIICTNNK